MRKSRHADISRRTLTLMLAMAPGIGGKSLVRILARNDLLGCSPAAFLRLGEDELRREYRLSTRAIRSIINLGDDPSAIEEFEARLSVLGVAVVTAADVHYPARLEAMDPDAPGILFLYGNLKLLEAKTFCVLASRNTLPADLELIERIAEEGVLRGEVLVSGTNRPEYQRSAIVPLRWGSPRILCLDQGMFRVLGDDLKDEAFRAARLWRYEFDPKTDLVVSPFRPTAEFIGINNKVRDRLVGSLSEALHFVQITPGGNMERIARLALQAGRDVQVSDRIPSYRSLTSLGASVIAT